MNCREAQELFGLISDLPDDHPQRKMLEWHVLGCEYCAAEYSVWQESVDIIQELPVEVSAEEAERVNRRVMDRIYAESPWLAPGGEHSKITNRIRRRVSLWSACFLAVFLCSVLVFLIGGYGKDSDSISPATGVLQPVVITEDMGHSSELPILDLSTVSRGVVEPFVVQMGPAYPQYWMVLSMAGMVLALVSYSGIRRARR
ncbi:anti-sigma factor [Paenibacillus ihumii]|uniref:hypothetical protein n=1 Tax=Paenibacillus ihumii TaxID=687436 RepID=UPI0006D85660|nr:hypothetical protein [Paenibacillus ihumii]